MFDLIIPYHTLAGLCLLIVISGFILFMLGAHGNITAMVIGIIFIFGGFAAGGYMESLRPFDITPAYSWDTNNTTQNITSLSDESAFSVNGHGSFILGSGYASVNGASQPVYVFYKVLPEGYQRGTINADSVIIKEDEENHPYIEWDYTYTIGEKRTYPDTGSVVGGGQTSVLTHTFIHVPNGTVIKEFKV